jgi:hypothetical protein
MLVVGGGPDISNTRCYVAARVEGRELMERWRLSGYSTVGVLFHGLGL